MGADAMIRVPAGQHADLLHTFDEAGTFEIGYRIGVRNRPSCMSSGRPDRRSRTFTVTDDTAIETTETAVLNVGGVEATGTILDNDKDPTVTKIEAGGRFGVDLKGGDRRITEIRPTYRTRIFQQGGVARGRAVVA